MKSRFLFVLFTLSFYSLFSVTNNSMKDSEKIKEKIKSCVLWSAIGDALGRVTEFKNMKQIYKEYPNGIRSFDDFKDNDFYKKNGKKIALYTDDTQMAMMVFESCLNSKKEKLDLNKTMEDLADRFVKWVCDPDGGNLDDKNGLSHLRAPGKTCIASCKELNSRMGVRDYFYKKYPKESASIMYFAWFRDRVWGERCEYTVSVLSDFWWRSGKGHEKAIESEGGSGAVMRAWPFGLCFYDDPELAAQWAAEHSKLTHRNSISLAACAAIATGVAYSIQCKSVEFITEKMIEAAAKYNTETAAMMFLAVGYVKEDSSSKKERSSNEYIFNKFQGWAAHEAIAATIYIFNKTPDDVQKAVEMAVNTPGDSDTIATLVGALVGAYSGGFNKIEPRWLDLLEDSDKLLELVLTL